MASKPRKSAAKKRPAAKKFHSITITDDRQTNYPVSINGRSRELPGGQLVKVSAEELGVLKDSGVKFEEA